MRTLSILTLLATVAFVAAPAVTPPFMGYAPDQFGVLIVRPAIQPAFYAFAIWGVIYPWLMAHAAFGLWRRSDDPAWQPSRLPLLAAVGLGTVLVLATLVQSRRPAMPIYGATVVWAIIGVVVVNWGSVALVAYAALIGAVLLTTATAVLYRRAAA